MISTCLRKLSGLNIDLQFFSLPLNYTDWYIMNAVKKKYVWCEMNSIGLSRQGMRTIDKAGNICYETICENSSRMHYMLHQWMTNYVPARISTCRPSFLTQQQNNKGTHSSQSAAYTILNGQRNLRISFFLRCYSDDV